MSERLAVKILTAGFLAVALLLSGTVLSGAAIVDSRDSLRHGSFCPAAAAGTACKHELDLDAPALLDDLLLRAQITMDRQLSEFETALFVAAGIPSEALR